MKMNRITIIISFLSLFAFSLACEEDVLPDNQLYSYEQTQCSDPWGNTNDAGELQSLVKTYLSEKNIEVIESSVSVADLAFCSACTCPSGKTIFVRLALEDGQRLLDLNEGWEAN